MAGYGWIDDNNGKNVLVEAGGLAVVIVIKIVVTMVAIGMMVVDVLVFMVK